VILGRDQGVKQRLSMRLSKKSIFAVVVIGLILIGIGVFGLFLLNQEPHGGFGIYVSGNNQLIISDRDIVWYNWTSHEIKLTAEGVGKIEALKVPMSGTPFVIKLNDKEIYNGSFWVSISSISYSGIVINTLEIQNNIVKIEKGYPSSGFFKGTDPRNNSEIFDYFQKIGKLVQ
jgi:hypothetical protein